jgi:hypothetical protein
MEKSSPQSSENSNIWRSLLFDANFALSSYSQKVNAAFQYILHCPSASKNLPGDSMKISLESKHDEDSFRLQVSCVNQLSPDIRKKNEDTDVINLHLSIGFHAAWE